MKSRRLQFLFEILALLFVFGLYAVANNAGCVFEHIEFGNSHSCFPASVTIPPSLADTNSGVIVTLGGVFRKNDDSNNTNTKFNAWNLFRPLFRRRVQVKTTPPSLFMHCSK